MLLFQLLETEIFKVKFYKNVTLIYKIKSFDLNIYRLFTKKLNIEHFMIVFNFKTEEKTRRTLTV